ncbi:thiol:disulfide interchange protein DsbA/DsbL [Vibrio tapetis subsp. quintayensis]|uniref:thiol:disulfide interchange protein DsbA/DsbL n=1 Tax=Vibrio tapetis TaxID=52443 RepID=UPI0025B616DD|nr:thiol:disulfide interchange protein DsbA/DsbL [Vibrio tapetis]MDN3681185.1 thiol:disulfide interchange protein DsbA/DsbL [Vibrio tapetis subsp. quintayensis]
MSKNKFSILVALVSSFFLIACSENDQQPQKGQQYSQLPTTLTQSSITPVTEVFSLTCGHCRTMESMVPQIEDGIKQPISKVHVTFNESAQIGALIYYAAQMQLDNTPDHAMMDELFEAVQSRDHVDTAAKQKAIEEIFNSRGLVSPYQFDEIQQKALFEELSVAESITTQGQFNSVPTFIINGKYQLITSGHKDVNDIVNTINYLLSQP